MSTDDSSDPVNLLKQEFTESKDITETDKFNLNDNEDILDNYKQYDESHDNETYPDSVKNEVLDIKLENSEIVDPNGVAEISPFDKKCSTITKEEIEEEDNDVNPENDKTGKVRFKLYCFVTKYYKLIDYGYRDKFWKTKFFLW